MKTIKFILSLCLIVLAVVAFISAGHTKTAPDQSGWIMVFFASAGIFGGLNYIKPMMYAGAMATFFAFIIFMSQLSGIIHPADTLWHLISYMIAPNF